MQQKKNLLQYNAIIYMLLKDVIFINRGYMTKKWESFYHFEKSLLPDNAIAYQQCLVLILVRYLFFHH